MTAPACTPPAIAVVADDLTGAAELAAAAADLGLSAEVRTSFDPGRADFTDCAADVVAVDADTRCRNAAEAARAVADLAERLLRAGRDWIYKKTDSVLRGNVRAEIGALLAATGRRCAVLIPANPRKGRVIRGGVYYVNGTPLAETVFADDPEHPRRSSHVVELLDGPATDRAAAGVAAAVAIAALDATEPLARAAGTAGIVVPDATCGEDLARRAAELDGHTLPAGGVEFFEAVLRAALTRRTAAGSGHPAGEGGPAAWRSDAGGVLFVCGSAAAWRQDECERHGVPVLPMPEDLLASASRPARGPRTGEAAALIGEWASHIASAVGAAGRAMAAIGRDRPVAAPPHALTDLLVEAVADVLRRVAVARVCVEGGATAAALLRRTGWARLIALPASPPGVAALRPTPAARGVGDALRVKTDAGEAPMLLLKPGSYPWPPDVWQPSESQRSDRPQTPGEPGHGV